MDIYETVKTWVETQAGRAGIDRLGHGAGEIGLFPQGLQVLGLREDVVGNRYRQVRYRFWLRLVLPPGEAAAKLVLQLQQDAPNVGLSATEGTFKKAASDGLAIYEIRLTAEREEKL